MHPGLDDEPKPGPGGLPPAKAIAEQRDGLGEGALGEDAYLAGFGTPEGSLAELAAKAQAGVVAQARGAALREGIGRAQRRGAATGPEVGSQNPVPGTQAQQPRKLEVGFRCAEAPGRGLELRVQHRNLGAPGSGQPGARHQAQGRRSPDVTIGIVLEGGAGLESCPRFSLLGREGSRDHDKGQKHNGSSHGSFQAMRIYSIQWYDLIFIWLFTYLAKCVICCWLWFM